MIQQAKIAACNASSWVLKIKYIFTFILICSVLTACGGGGDSSSSNNGSSSTPSPSSNENLSGLWDGTISEGGQTYAVRGLLFDEDVNDGLPGDFYAISLDAEAIYLGSILSNRNNLQGSAGMYSAYVLELGGGLTAAQSDGLFGQSTITGVGNAKGTIRATGTLDTGTVSSISLDYDASYDRPSSLSIISGVWNTYDTVGNLLSTMTVQNDGSFSGGNASGCQFSGKFSIINSNQNLYRFAFDYFGCVLEGYAAEGYSAFFDDSSINGRMETVYKVTNGEQTEAVIFLEMSRSSD